jgi:hypothetical protein
MNVQPGPLLTPPLRARRLLVVAALAVALTCGSCGIPTDDRPQEIDPALLEDITDRS